MLLLKGCKSVVVSGVHFFLPCNETMFLGRPVLHLDSSPCAIYMGNVPNGPPPPTRGRVGGARRTQLRRALWAALLLSFVPYFMPLERRPPLYRDGKPAQDIARTQKARRASAFIGGDITSIEFGHELFLHE